MWYSVSGVPLVGTVGYSVSGGGYSGVQCFWCTTGGSVFLVHPQSIVTEYSCVANLKYFQLDPSTKYIFYPLKFLYDLKLSPTLHV